MRKLLCVAVVPALFLLSSCATVGTTGGGQAVQAKSGASYYCWKNRLTDDGGKLMCNWEDSVSAACSGGISSIPMEKGAVGSGPKDAGRCTNGQWLVQVTTR